MHSIDAGGTSDVSEIVRGLLRFDETEGFIKVVVDAETDRILGAVLAT
jgi:pyruvate/2-oxoglutarate dehydrogenase complex dihydrolipoamide dehydrogenase (E3) component